MTDVILKMESDQKSGAEHATITICVKMMQDEKSRVCCYNIVDSMAN